MLNAFYADYIKKKDNGKDSISFYEINGKQDPLKDQKVLKNLMNGIRLLKPFQL